ncbi:pilus (MSHA type) biogenesis protein MshL [Campylobacter geochelonis]|uniref:pilus (MSHA type) biogenesis protein MshL n=1 Tax=Campylobacter geochelonis TaxID=1780362 RepID=UPI000770B29D|nr:pilus (MSHA type) biogenesis protein MshL [Campylobacter geochelonis]CZE49441.1 type II and III secretion system protein [Campylobacter geochelonis]CZE51512.1 type II and III secretion system protein [Campylobacter geochelonis]
MSLLHINKKFGVAFVLAMSLAASSLSANSTCDRRAFNIAVTDVVTLNEMLVQLSDVCKFSVVAKDAIAADELKKQINGINIKDLSLREVFNVLISENNLDYEYSNSVLKVSALQTKTFKIDYITSIREGTAITKASVDSAPVEVGNDGDNERESDNQISTKERFHFWENVSGEITAILNNGTEKYVAIAPIINENAGLITVTATKAQINRVAKYVADMQRRLKRQVILDVSIIAVDLRNDYTTGIDWSKFNIGFNSYLDNTGTSSLYRFSNGGGQTIGMADPKVSGSNNPPIVPSINQSGYSGKASNNRGIWAIGANFNFNIEGMINFLETKGKTKVISSPKVMTLNNQPALISVGDNINYRVKEESTNPNQINPDTKNTYTQYSVFIGILLNILPEISDDNKIMLRINPSLSNFKYEDDNTRQMNIREIAPDTLQKKLSTVVTVGDGDTVILGGLIGQTKGKDNTSVPLLSSIPLIGDLFQSTKDKLTTTELVFVVTPRIFDNTNVPIRESLKELGYSKSLYSYE